MKTEMTIRQLKEFIKWAKKEGVLEVRVGDVYVAFDPRAHLSLNLQKPGTGIANTDDETPEQKQKRIHNELFWSVAD